MDILFSHIEALLARPGIPRLRALHQPFDPAAMSAVAVDPSTQWPPQTVLEELVAGYCLHGELLRVAQVKVSTNKA
jgi:molecular chaperone GrpE (heat shock protein)